MTLVLATMTVLAIIYVVPLVVYGTASAFGGLELPSESTPQRFLLGILITKLGTAVAFVLLLQLTSTVWVDRWLLYALIWFGMFAASEVGDAISGRSTWREALPGILSEAIYAPASAFAAYRLLGVS
jgi:hypothetical protein